MIRLSTLYLCLISTITPGCTSTSSHDNARVLNAIDIDEIDGNFVAQEFAQICLSENRSIQQLDEYAKLQGWRKADFEDLERSKLTFLHRKILSIPGGGGRYYENQTLLNFNSGPQDLIVNLIERFDRQDNLVRTECALYAYQEVHLPVCSAVGILLKRPPDSNQKFPSSNSHFIRWNAVINSKSTSIRCEGIDIIGAPKNELADPHVNLNGFVGTVLITIVDHQISKNLRRATTRAAHQTMEK